VYSLPEKKRVERVYNQFLKILRLMLNFIQTYLKCIKNKKILSLGSYLRKT
jgi:hypothetical protein